MFPSTLDYSNVPKKRRTDTKEPGKQIRWILYMFYNLWYEVGIVQKKSLISDNKSRSVPFSWTWFEIILFNPPTLDRTNIVMVYKLRQGNLNIKIFTISYHTSNSKSMTLSAAESNLGLHWFSIIISIGRFKQTYGAFVIKKITFTSENQCVY